MDSTGSFLKTVLERVRGYLDDSDFDAKYQDQFVVQHVIMPALVDVWSRVSLNADNPVFLSYRRSARISAIRHNYRWWISNH